MQVTKSLGALSDHRRSSILTGSRTKSALKTFVKQLAINGLRPFDLETGDEEGEGEDARKIEEGVVQLWSLLDLYLVAVEAHEGDVHQQVEDGQHTDGVQFD